jgi:hypothetical protein
MGSNYDMITRTRFEAKEVSRTEFETLKRFGDYEELSDGTLMRMEGTRNFASIVKTRAGSSLAVMAQG